MCQCVRSYKACRDTIQLIKWNFILLNWIQNSNLILCTKKVPVTSDKEFFLFLESIKRCKGTIVKIILSISKIKKKCQSIKLKFGRV